MVDAEIKREIQKAVKKLKKTGKKKGEKILKKPKGKAITPLSSEKALRSFAQNSGPMVREIEPQEIELDDRSLFFKQEFAMEQRGINKWLS